MGKVKIDKNGVCAGLCLSSVTDSEHHLGLGGGAEKWQLGA